MNHEEQQQDALEAARDEAAAELRATTKEVNEYSRKPAIGPGKLVAPKRGCDPLRSGASAYDFAVVIMNNPFTLISEHGDMVWSTRRIEDFDVIGDATPDMTKAVDERLQREAEEGVREEAEDLVRRAREAGVVLTITQEPLKPLAMSHYDTVVSVRADRRQ